jgi:hypothetical protein
MGRALLAVGGLLLLCFAILGVAVYLGREEESVAVDQILAEDLSRQFALAAGTPDPVEVSVVTNFEWDELLIVAEDTPRDDIDRELGFDFQGDLAYDAESKDLLIFLRDGRLAKFADYRGTFEFSGVDRPFARFDTGEAVFRVQSGTIVPVR